MTFSTLEANLKHSEGLLGKTFYPFVVRSKFHMVLPQSTNWERCAKISVIISAGWHWRCRKPSMHTVGNSCVGNCEWITEAMEMPTSCCCPWVFFKILFQWGHLKHAYHRGLFWTCRSGHPSVVTEHMGIFSKATVECQETAPSG